MKRQGRKEGGLLAGVLGTGHIDVACENAGAHFCGEHEILQAVISLLEAHARINLSGLEVVHAHLRVSCS